MQRISHTEKEGCNDSRLWLILSPAKPNVNTGSTKPGKIPGKPMHVQSRSARGEEDEKNVTKGANRYIVSGHPKGEVFLPLVLPPLYLIIPKKICFSVSVTPQAD